MSGKSESGPRRDARVLRTREQLGDALVDLMHEKAYAGITVRELLERAEVGRATFYAHFSDKDDLLLSDAEDFFERLASHLERSGERSSRVFPVRELFSHVAEMGVFLAALRQAGKLHDLLELGRGHFALGIERRLRALARAPSDALARQALCQAQAGALIALLLWWLCEGRPASAAQMDEHYHASFWRGASAGQQAR